MFSLLRFNFSHLTSESDASARPQLDLDELRQTAVCRLRQGRSGLGLDQRSVNCVDKSIDVNVFPEVGIRNRVAGLRLSLAYVDRVSEAVSVCVSQKKVDRDTRIARCG